MALTVLALTAGSGRAEDPAPDRPGSDLGLKLRPQQSLLPPTPPDPTDSLPVFVEADRIQATQERDLQAEGEAVLRRRGQPVFAGKLRHTSKTNQVTARSSSAWIQLRHHNGSYASFNLDEDTGYIDNPTYRFRQFHARGHANQLLIRDRDATGPSGPPIPTATWATTTGT
jgi:lipopolysaccharide assembly outer membrane protein LptD (OstA)